MIRKIKVGSVSGLMLSNHSLNRLPSDTLAQDKANQDNTIACLIPTIPRIIPMLGQSLYHAELLVH
jgi:hypothetical protein